MITFRLQRSDTMKISVLTVCFNAEKTIGRTIASFLEQDHPDREMIVIDGASTDATLDVVRSMASECIRIVSEPDRGMYDALNKGLRLFNGDAIGVLNADDCYHDASVLARVAETLEQADIVHGHLDFIDSAGRVTRRWRAGPRPARGFATGWMPAHPTFYVTRRVVDAVGEFDLTLATASDYDWMLRALELNGFASSIIDHVMVDMALGGKSTASIASHIRHNLEALAARRRWLGSGPLDYALFAKPARKLGQFVALRAMR